MKTYKVIISGKEVDITQNDDGSFNKPNIVKELEPVGTALKPAFEPICMAMKPLSEKNYVANVLKYGTGGINVDESRVGNEELTYQKVSSMGKTGEFSGQGLTRKNGGLVVTGEQTVVGRFPANLVLEDCEEVRECFPETGKGSDKPRNRNTIGSFGMPNDTTPEYADSGNASRFFKSIIYQAKASKSERNRGCEELEEKYTTEQNKWTENDYRKGDGEKTVSPTKNNHPTVKPIALMEYLIKMVTPKGGIVLDPFAGSGSTLVAAKQNGFQYIGIEMTEEYIPIIEARLKGVTATLF